MQVNPAFMPRAAARGRRRRGERRAGRLRWTRGNSLDLPSPLAFKPSLVPLQGGLHI